MEIIVDSLKDTKKVAQKLARIFTGGEIILLNGDLGAGKTTFARFVLQALGVKDEITSPTFTIMKEYKTRKFNIYHFDMYRVSGWDDLYTTGYFEYIESGGVLAIEWSENIENALPEDAIRITIKRLDETSRDSTIDRGDDN